MTYYFGTYSFFLADGSIIRTDVIHSKKGTNLTSWQNGMDRLNQIAIVKSSNIEWIFSPSSAPNFGGAWESLIISAQKKRFSFYENMHFLANFFFLLWLKWIRSWMIPRLAVARRTQTTLQPWPRIIFCWLVTILAFPPTWCTSSTQTPGSEGERSKLLPITCRKRWTAEVMHSLLKKKWCEISVKNWF